MAHQAREVFRFKRSKFNNTNPELQVEEDFYVCLDWITRCKVCFESGTASSCKRWLSHEKDLDVLPVCGQ